jgi:ABC-type lipoprotein export system ATPase subunit
MMPMWLRVDQVSKTFHGGDAPVVAIANVSLGLDAGQFLAIRGPSGCGKSTLLLTIGTLLAPDRGEVVLGGEHPYRMTPDKRASFRGECLGFVFQQFHLVPYLSVLDNVLAPTLSLAQGAAAVSPKDARRRALELLERFGLLDRAGHTPAKLSSGERQRCALARALLNRPKLLLADEPTGNLDTENADTVLTSMREFVTDGGAVLLVTHDDRAAAAADSILWMNRGTLLDSQPLQAK